ncbi:MAG: glycoside hydrolase family 2 TIM barrel-domain containing protein [Christensenellales bacterium]
MKRYLFNDGWLYSAGATGSLAAFLSDIAPPVPVTLPHDALIGTERVEDQSLNPVAFYKGVNMSYSKEIQLTEECLKDKTYILEFEGVYQMGYLYVNNAFVGECKYGYGNYFHDITHYLKPGKNVIKMTVKNGGNPAGRWYTGGGIYRDVNLYVADKLHIKVTGTRVSTEDVDDVMATLKVIVPVENKTDRVMDAVIVNEVLCDGGHVVSSARAPITLLPGQEEDVRLRMVVEEAKLWDEFTPNLYTIRTTLYKGEEVCDTFEDQFGIRKLQLDVKRGLRINGKTVKFRGGCIHHDNGVLGAATFEASEERRVRLMKEAGYNAIRMAHHPMSKAMLRACDRLGVYVMDEFSDVWCTTKAEFDYGLNFATNWELDAKNLAYKDYNHPSVIFYSIGNEIPETGNKFDAAWGKKLTDAIRSVDDTRYVVNSVNLLLSIMGRMDEIIASMGIGGDEGGDNKEINSLMSDLGSVMGELSKHPIASAATEEAFAQVDISGYNYSEDRYESDCVQFPNRIMVGSETFPNKLAKNWEIIERLPNVIGDFVWTSWDYLGEVGIGRITHKGEEASFAAPYPWRIADCGTININGVRQPVSYWREIVWRLRKEPFIAVRPPAYYKVDINPTMWGWSDSRISWNWPGYEGKPIEVEVYADADEVELFVNGASQGVKKVGEEVPFFVKFDTVYTPGDVKAVSRKGDETYEWVLKTASDDVSLAVSAECTAIKVQTEVGYINVTVVDDDGVCNPVKNVPITVEVEGGVIAGIGSGDPKSIENYTGNTCVTYEGRALVVVRGFEPGTLTVKVSAENLETKTVRIEVK